MFVANIVRNGSEMVLHVAAESKADAFEELMEMLPSDAKIVSLLPSDLELEI